MSSLQTGIKGKTRTKKRRYVLEPTVYLCPRERDTNSFPGELKKPNNAHFVTSKEFRRALDQIFRD